MIVATCSVQRKSAFSLLFPTRTRASSVFLFLPSPLHLLGVKSWARVSCVWRLHPFSFTCFFAMEVVQSVEFQIVAVKVKVKAGFAFTLKRLIYSLLRGEVKGEGKNGKLAESASAYIRVGACPARRVKGILCGVGRFWEKQGRKSRKVGTFGEKVGLYFSNGVGEGEKNACFPLFYVCQSRNRGEFQAKTPRQTDFFGAKWDLGREFLARWREKHPEEGGFCPQSGRNGRKRVVWGGKSQGGDRAKKWVLLPILPCYEVAKWAQMIFSRIFFRRSLAGNGEMPYLCTRNREATLLQERVTLWKQRGSKSAAVIFESLT